MTKPLGVLPSDPRELLALTWRRKWVILIPLVAFTAFAAFIAKSLPSVYRASTTILVEKPKVPEAFVKSTVTTQIDDRLSTIKQQILSRTRLEAIIRQFDLYAEERAKLPMESVVGIMRRAVAIEVVRGNTAFTVSFSGRDPRIVRDVTNELAAVFIEENSRVREEQAASTSEFLDSQILVLKETLARQESQVRMFKERFLGELPQQQDANLRALDRLQLQLQTLAAQIRSAEDRKFLLQVQLSQTPEFNEVVTRNVRRDPVTGAVVTSLAPAAPLRDPLLDRLEQARGLLAQLQGRYTDLHPDVVRAKRQVEELEMELANRSPAVPTTAGPAGGASGAADGRGVIPSDRPVAVSEIQRVPNPAYKQVESQLVTVEREIEALRKSQTEVSSRIQELQRKVENVPRLEQQLMELTRDYENTRRAYESLVAKKLDAQLSENLEKRQKGEQFRVLDPAVLPQSPYKPDRRRIVALGVALGLAVGLGGAVGLELLNPSVRWADELKTLARGLPLLGTVPLVRDRRTVLRQRLVSMGVGLLVLALGAAAAAGAARYRDDIIKLGVFEYFLR